AWISPLQTSHLLDVPSSNTWRCPHIALSAIPAYAVCSRLRLESADSPQHSAESGSLSYGPLVRLRLLSTSPHGDAVTFDYEVMACLDADLHRADVLPSRAHGLRPPPERRRWGSNSSRTAVRGGCSHGLGASRAARSADHRGRGCRLLWPSTVNRRLATGFASTCRLKLFRIACQPSRCCSTGCVVSLSKVTRTFTPFESGANSTWAVRSPKEYSISSCLTMFVYVPAKSKPMLPSFASILDEKAPPTRRSTVAAVVCQSSDAAFHCLMSSGVVYARHTSSTGAAMRASTVIFNASLLCRSFEGQSSARYYAPPLR